MFRSKQSQNNQDSESSRVSKVRELRAALGPLSGRSLKYCTDGCLRQYLVARNWNVEKAKKMLEGTLQWRATFKPEEIRWHEVAYIGKNGLLFRADIHDRLGRAVIIIRPAMQKTKAVEDNIRQVVYTVENVILSLPEGQEQMTWLLDFTGWSFSNLTNIPVKISQGMADIMQNYYPERLGLCIIYNAPRIFEAFWKVVKQFVDPITLQKIKFVSPKNRESEEIMRLYFDVDNLPSEFGGKASLKYDHEEFSRLMTEDDVKTAKFWGFDP